jgi:single-stranded-DNA-specific exonuclease
VAPGALCAADVAFQIAPRLNAAGRYSQARLAYDLLCSQDTHTAERGAVLLEEINQRRKKDVETGLGLALAGLVGRYGSLETSVLPPALLVVGDWPHTGVQGLIAGKLAQATNRPTLVGTPASARTDAGLVLVGGSGRGTAGAPILPLLEATHALWHSYGGHGMACGFALLERDVTAAQDALSAAAARLYAPPGEPAVELDAVLHHHELTRVEAEQLARLEPTGQGNPTPLFLVEDLQVVTAKAVGSDKRTLKLELRTSGGKTIGGIAFGKGALAPLLAEGRQVDVAANLTLNTYRETTSVQLVVRDLRPAEKTT